MEFILKGFIGYLMMPIMKIKLDTLGKKMVEDFAYYVEYGTAHPRKVKALQKNKS